MIQQARSETFVPLHQAASRLGVPAAWLKAEAHAGRVPHLKAGRRILFSTEAAERALLARAQGEEGPADGS